MNGLSLSRFPVSAKLFCTFFLVGIGAGALAAFAQAATAVGVSPSAVRESLAPGGRLVIVDFRKDAELAEGPPMEMRLDRKDLEEELSRAGFRLSEEHGFLPDQYFVVFTE